jgi:hypothetical protein
VDGILGVVIRDVDSGLVLLEDDVSYGVAEDKRQLKHLSDRAKNSVATQKFESAPLVGLTDPEAAKLIAQARSKVIPFLDDDEAAAILEAVRALEVARGGDVPAARSRLAAALRPYSYLF